MATYPRNVLIRRPPSEAAMSTGAAATLVCSPPARSLLVSEAGGGAGEEDRSQQVGALEQTRRRTVVADLALLDEVGPVRVGERARCLPLDQEHGEPLFFMEAFHAPHGSPAGCGAA